MKIAIVNDEIKTVINVIKADSVEDVKNGIIAESWMSPDVVYNIEDGVRVELPKAQLTKEELRNQYKDERGTALKNLDVEVDGMIFDARPKDYSNIQFGIETFETEWILKDNSVAQVTTEQLQQVLTKGIIAVKQIWKDHRTKLKTL